MFLMKSFGRMLCQNDGDGTLLSYFEVHGTLYVCVICSSFLFIVGSCLRTSNIFCCHMNRVVFDFVIVLIFLSY